MNKRFYLKKLAKNATPQGYQEPVVEVNGINFRKDGDLNIGKELRNYYPQVPDNEIQNHIDVINKRRSVAGIPASPSLAELDKDKVPFFRLSRTKDIQFPNSLHIDLPDRSSVSQEEFSKYFPFYVSETPLGRHTAGGRNAYYSNQGSLVHRSIGLPETVKPRVTSLKDVKDVLTAKDYVGNFINNYVNKGRGINNTRFIYSNIFNTLEKESKGAKIHESNHALGDATGNRYVKPLTDQEHKLKMEYKIDRMPSRSPLGGKLTTYFSKPVEGIDAAAALIRGIRKQNRDTNGTLNMDPQDEIDLVQEVLDLPYMEFNTYLNGGDFYNKEQTSRLWNFWNDPSTTEEQKKELLKYVPFLVQNRRTNTIQNFKHASSSNPTKLRKYFTILDLESKFMIKRANVNYCKNLFRKYANSKNPNDILNYISNFKRLGTSLSKQELL